MFLLRSWPNATPLLPTRTGQPSLGIFATVPLAVMAAGPWMNFSPYMASTSLFCFSSHDVTAFPVGRNARRCAVLAANGPLVDLSTFYNLEFAITPESFEWTLAHTHEDWAHVEDHTLFGQRTLLAEMRYNKWVIEAGDVGR